MDWASDIIFSYQEVPESPELKVGEEFLRLDISELSYEEGLLQFGVFLSAMLPTATALRYQRLEEAFVLVVSDMDRGECIAVKSRNDFFRVEPGSESPTNLLSNPPFPLDGRGKNEPGAYRGAWVSATLALQTPYPRHAPNIFVHAVMENYFSNVVGIDLLRKETVVY